MKQFLDSILVVGLDFQTTVESFPDRMDIGHTTPNKLLENLIKSI